jgi:hypothetical protein
LDKSDVGRSPLPFIKIRETYVPQKCKPNSAKESPQYGSFSVLFNVRN